MKNLFQPLSFKHGAVMKNRFMLAPMTNLQSFDDGRLSDEEFRWLTLRAKGGFGLTMTCASHVQAVGKGFPGQLGCFSNDHVAGLSRLASAIRAENSLAVIQLHHAGMRSPEDLVGGQPVCPSDNEETGARALALEEVRQLREDFVTAAQRAEKAGFDGVEIHGAHGYILCQFLSPVINQRNDRYGGSLENRARLVFEIIEAIRDRCRPGFLLGVRLSPERFDLKLGEMIEVSSRLLEEGVIDFLDVSLWDVFKEPVEERFHGRSLFSYFAELDRGGVRLGIAGKIHTPHDARKCLEDGADFILLGRAAILHHDFPLQVFANPDFEPVKTPVSREYLHSQGLSEAFVNYMSNWTGFIGDEH
ncbi:MAG: NADH:flavin oxidoreductase [Xanthomonadales bacterium]|jgi:2,4-dienoyl-CoA reductase-like NADH-dependent reductase (Old Yellow Enzyme family)|nr:NADH:flavin oxidoreductase [Xanthomonadales bacterium]MDH3924197.1 NADH:flavin oxidoreductase [Xanthomonadales bacterium]MDH3940486.1 NADH:flavin oxidoreductase [Xanthomonadales bacterium]MDH4000787.1 NADH:flavin oxidoreductase [Xanthomonadales bacterium]